MLELTLNRASANSVQASMPNRIDDSEVGRSSPQNYPVIKKFELVTDIVVNNKFIVSTED